MSEPKPEPGVSAPAHLRVRTGAEARRVDPRVVDAAAATGLGVGLGLVCWVFSIPWFFGNLLVLGAPLAYLLARSPVARAMIRPKFVARYVVFIVVFVDYLCLKFDAWDSSSLFPKFEGITIEQVTCFTLFIGLVLAVNERFFAAATPGRPRRFGKPALVSLFLGGLVVALVPPLHGLVEDLTYLTIALAIYPTVVLLAIAVNPGVLRELALTTLVFTPFVLGFELLALENDYWSFPGEYIGSVTVAGLAFPTEEMIFFVVMSAPAVVAAYSVYKNWKGLRRPVAVGGP